MNERLLGLKMQRYCLRLRGLKTQEGCLMNARLLSLTSSKQQSTSEKPLELTKSLLQHYSMEMQQDSTSKDSSTSSGMGSALSLTIGKQSSGQQPWSWKTTLTHVKKLERK
jgi:hypothetical protein